ncbi:ABC transporter ATP-binding protein [Anaerovorax odorimutans]|uniref:ABC transporter ATP-binding protein n=1 Tax=Anaerovorax odorimutans TaxID=109327 RepID=UPI000414A8D3|nr:ABC transporter ATP-binding protein [Anaerovorax odorimutans]
MPLLSIQNLNTVFYSKKGEVKACSNINLDLEQGEIVGLIGETGCGKSVLGMSVLNLLPNNARISGKIIYKDLDLLNLPSNKMRQIRGKEISLLPQSPATSLNPVVKIGSQILEGFQLHRGMKKDIAINSSIKILNLLGLKNSEKNFKYYPHQLSGGMKQRILAAISITGNPSLLIADEPTKGLDALMKAQVVDLLHKLTKETGTSLLLITHDLKVASSLCDEIAVMYSGEIVERGSAEKVLNNPYHPYTQGLLKSMPEKGLHPIKGYSPSLLEKLPGCRFYSRCPLRNNKCNNSEVPYKEIDGTYVRCFGFD